MADGRQVVCRLWVVLLLAAGAALACGQTIHRPALMSGSTSVVLIARVESLSVVANAMTGFGAGLAGQPVAGAQPISVTTSWAVPANFTTFRLSESFGLPGAFSAAPAGGGTGSMEARARFAVEGEDVLVVDSGATNEARTRTDELDPGAAGGPGSNEEGGLLNILVQAL